MFVSILQRFGFKSLRPADQLLQSRASHRSRPDTPMMEDAGVHPEAASQRRQAVKATPKKTSKSASKAAVKLKTSKIAAKPVGKARVQAAVKAKARPAPKAAVKTAAKSISKPLKTAKTLAKSAAKPTSKPPAKSPLKVTVVVKKPLTKQVSQSSAKKPAVKAAPKAVKKMPVQTAAKNTAKVTLKTTAKPAEKTAKLEVKPSAKPTVKASVAVVKAIEQAQTQKISKKLDKTPAAVVLVAPVAPAKPAIQSNGLPLPPPLKPGRRSSSRALAHMPPPAPMVPTHAPDAAKASYSTMTERVIAPPPHVAAKKDPKLANNWKAKAADTLTDEEVKAMPDTEYMNDTQMAFFRYKLSILKQDIHNSAGATTEHLREDTTVVPDPADRATIEEEHALELRTRDRERKLLKKIEQSIGRIDSGDYGYCDETGEPIGVGRLIARPTASLSLEAQQRRELKQKMFGD